VTVADRFWAKVSKGEPSDCWPWTASRNSKGYGVFGIGPKNYKAHRVALWITTGAWPEPGKVVCHRCDNPSCVNPSHLYVGTASDNVQDCMKRGRYRQPPQPPAERRPRGERHCRAKLTENQVREIIGSSEPKLALAERFGVSRLTVSLIKRGLTWKSVREASGETA
jgi:hypothetical protein